jgi:exodeoxyribonuclease V
MAAITINDLSRDQLEVYESLLDWIHDPAGLSVLTMGGYAGTGKSTLVSLLAEQVELSAFCAYTGKASSVLRRKLRDAGMETTGVKQRDEDGNRSLNKRAYCGTIHALIYRPCECREPGVVEVQKPCPECGAETTWSSAPLAQSVCAAGHVERVKTLKAFETLKPKKMFVYAKKNEDGSCAICGDKGWLRRDVLDRDYGLIIVDEASMVDDVMLRDLQSYEIPILAVGDHGQLPPVGGHGSLMKSPHLRLEKIHRVAEGNPIVMLSKMVREQGRLPDQSPGEAVAMERLKRLEYLLEERYTDADAARLLEMGLACYTNRRRVGLNVAVRRVRGTARNGRELPRAGEHVVGLRNMKGRNGAPPVYNGMRGVLQGDTAPKKNVNYRGEDLGESETHITGVVAFPEDEIDAQPFEILRAQFGRDKTFQAVEELAQETGLHSFAAAGALFDFGYAMTVHKMQGSAVDDLVVCVERPGPVSDEDWRRWLYTAVTRSSKRLTVLR